RNGWKCGCCGLGTGVREKCLLHCAPCVGNGDCNSDACGKHIDRKCAPGPNENLEFGYEAAETGHSNRSDGCNDECDCGERDGFVEMHPTECGEIASVRAVVDHAPYDGEQQARKDTVRKHLQYGSGEPD